MSAIHCPRFPEGLRNYAGISLLSAFVDYVPAEVCQLKTIKSEKTKSAWLTFSRVGALAENGWRGRPAPELQSSHRTEKSKEYRDTWRQVVSMASL